ncbi:hypothetical protein GTY83_13490 [Streptomyces sp. SID4928]|uniref:hypothetical protein n=1 Tax=Streptomyces TaxID=1883 RepID=UPI0001C19761|nr:hypothetical protein [Streptomyces sp. ACT-1]MYR50117.1 hypothetical protein [Streptomyces sp. SID4928]
MEEHLVRVLTHPDRTTVAAFAQQIAFTWDSGPVYGTRSTAAHTSSEYAPLIAHSDAEGVEPGKGSPPSDVHIPTHHAEYAHAYTLKRNI